MRRSPSIIPDAAKRDSYLDRKLGPHLDWIEIAGMAVAVLSLIEIGRQRPEGILITGKGDFYENRQLIAQLMLKYQVPTMCPYRDYVEAGALMAYAVDLAELLRRMARDVQQILTGGGRRHPNLSAHQIRASD
jgi:ABC-type uncharacterized transport system substrate-binding protein